jgi:hypothetical protein
VGWAKNSSPFWGIFLSVLPPVQKSLVFIEKTLFVEWEI